MNVLKYIKVVLKFIFYYLEYNISYTFPTTKTSFLKFSLKYKI